MASNLIVIMGASQIYGTLPLYCEQLREAHIEHVIVPVDDKPNINGGGNLGYRVDVFRKYADAYWNYEFIIISDAFDVTFYGESEQDVIERIPATHLLHAAEKNCYPDMGMAKWIEGPSPWRFANGGLVAGTPAQYVRWCDEVERHPEYKREMLDQQMLNILLSERSDLAIVDDTTEMFFCLFGGYDELEFVKGEPRNALYGTSPLFVHRNGKWTADEMFDRHKRSLA